MDSQNIKVLNYAPCFVAVSTRDRSIGLAPASDGTPSFEYFAMSEVEYINSQSPMIRNGALEFEDSVRAEVYAKLAIPDWETRCIFERDIDDMILNPSAEKMQRIVDITDVQTIERIRGHVHRLILEGRDVSVKVSRIVERRFEEINQGTRKSNIIVSAKESAKDDTQSTLAAMQNQIENLRAQLMKKMATPATEGEREAEATPEKVAVEATPPAITKRAATSKTGTAKKAATVKTAATKSAAKKTVTK